MYEIDKPEYLHLLWVIPVLWGIFALEISYRSRKQNKLFDYKLAQTLIPYYSVGKIVLSYILLSLAVVFLSLTLANPKIGIGVEKVKRQGSDIVFAVDASLSMLAEDVAPNRLEKAKQIVGNTIDKLSGDRIGLIVYAGSAFPLLPITNDYAAAKMFLKNINTNMLSSQGTSISDAIEISSRYFDKPSIKNKILFILSDGEDHSDDERAIETAKAFAQKGVKIFTVGIGKTTGAPIPIKKAGKVEGYKKDNEDNVVITKLDAETLKALSNAGAGKYMDGSTTKPVVDFILSLLGSSEKNDYGETLITTYKDQFVWFLLTAIIFLILQTILSLRSNRIIRKLNMFSNEPKPEDPLNKKSKNTTFFSTIGTVVFIFCSLNSNAQVEAKKLAKKAAVEYERGVFEQADSFFVQALKIDSLNSPILYNFGNSQYMQNNKQGAEDNWNKALKLAQSDKEKADILYNLGNASFDKKDYKKAEDFYKQSLKINPKDDNARYNLALAQLMRKEQENQQNQQDNKDNKDNKDKNKDDQNKDKQDNKDSKDKNKDDQNTDKQDNKDKDKQDKDQKDDKQDEKQDDQKSDGEQKQEIPFEINQMLNAVEKQEEKTKAKLEKAQNVGRKSKHQKDW